MASPPAAYNRRELNVSGLPTVVFANRSLIWWGTMGLMAIEGTMFAIMVVSYFYLRTRVNDWPPGISPPGILFGAINTSVFVISILPNEWIKKVAERGELASVRIGLVIISATGIANLGLRYFEFQSLNCQWDANAYASVVWTLLALHTVHLLTDWFDTVV